MPEPTRAAVSFEARVAAAWPPERWAGEIVIVAVSGGADSIALLRALAALRPVDAIGRLIAAHFNHRLRGDESDGDERFVADLAAKLGIECATASGATADAARERGDGLEAAARELRYRFLIDTARSRGARYIATAHTRDDQAETLLQRITRGTGLAGLGGIARARALDGETIGLIRPLLSVRRSEVEAYLAELGQPYRSDSSNTDRAYTRNRVRHDLLPLLEREYNPQIVDALARLATQADELREIASRLVEPLLAKSLVRSAAGLFELDCAALAREPRYLAREAVVRAWTDAGLPLQAMGFDEWDALAEMITTGAPAKRMFPGGVTAERNGTRLTVG
jgi:tRNA(Ile)-lysidine synthase